MTDLINIPVRNINDLEVVPDLPSNPKTLNNTKIPVGNLPSNIRGEALTVEQFSKIIADILPSLSPEAVYELANRYTKGEVDSRLLSKANKSDVDTALSNLSTTANKFYPTLAEANYYTTTMAVNDVVTVGEEANKGLWYKATAGATSLTKSPYDPLTQAKSYTDSGVTSVTRYSESLTVDYDWTMLTEEGFINSNGSPLNGAAFKRTGFLPIAPGESYKVYSYLAGTARHAWYDKNQVFISAFGDDQTALTEKIYTAPANAAFMRLSAYTTAQVSAYVKSKAYKVTLIQKIIQQHMPQVDASKIDYNSSDVKTTLDTVIAKQNEIITGQNGIVSQLDLASDKEAPYFVNTFQYTRSGKTPDNFNIVDVTARVSDTQMTVSDATAFIYSGSCVIYDPTADSYTSHNVIGINGTTITVMPPLPANPTQAQTMHDLALGQHLSLFGTKGLADYVLKSIQKYSYKKAENLIFRFNAALCAYLVWNNSDIYNGDASQLLIPVTKIGTAGNGGFTPGATNLAKICAMSNPKESYQNIGTNPHTQYLSRAYHLIDGVAGNGFEISFSGIGADGFMEIPLAVRDESYISSLDSQTYRTSGKARLQVFNDSTLIHDAVYAAGQVHSIFVDFVRAGVIKVRITCETSVPTFVALSGIFAYKKSSKTSKDKLFKDGDVLVFLMDSWGIYPVAATIGETPYTYPISNLAPKYQAMYPTGRISSGTHWISRRIQENLANQGVNVETYSYAFGGQTTRWAKYWLDAVLTMSPKPTHCVINFGINDNNSIGNPSNTFYDFDPEKMFANKAESAGGINGRTASFDEWELNLKFIAEKCIAHGVKPVIMMPSHTASANQAQSIRQNELVRLADGFDI